MGSTYLVLFREREREGGLDPSHWGHRVRVGGMSPEYRATGPPFGGAGSSGGDGMPPKDRGEGLGVPGTDSTADLPLTNLSNLVIGSSRPRHYLPVITEPPLRGAGEKKHARAPRVPSVPGARRVPSLPGVRSNTPSPRGSRSPLPGVRSNTPSPRGSRLSGVKKNTSSPRDSTLSRATSNTPSPRGSSTRVSQLTRSLVSLSINNVETPASPSPDARLGDTAACSGRESATSHRAMEKPGKGSSGGEVRRRPRSTATAGAGLSGGDAQQGPGSTAKIGAGLCLKAAWKPRAVTGSIGKMPQKTSAVTASSGETRQKKHAVTVLKGETQKGHHVMKSDRGLNGQMLQKNNAVTGVKKQEKQQKKHAVTGSTGKTQKEHSIKKSGGGSSGEMPRKKHRKMKTVQCKEPSAEEERQLEEERMKEIHEAEQAIEQLDKLGLGESISYQELKAYIEQLPSTPYFDDSIPPALDQLSELQIRGIMYRIKYCKFIKQKHNNGEIYNAEFEDDHPIYHLVDKLDCLEEDVTELKGYHLLHYLREKGILQEIQDDEIFDWSFIRTVAGLDDYQRLVPQNYGYCGYDSWAIYRGYFHSYEVELEYLKYWEELLKNLKWMEDYVPTMERPSLTWWKIRSRGCFQAIKIASCFSNITEGIARIAFDECIGTMCLDIFYYKELDGVYFEIWHRINKLKMTFRDALGSVYELNKFPRQHHKMKNALDDDDWYNMEKEFHICTTDITGEMTEDIARGLIADAIKSQRERPKFYAQYIKKKIEIARILGVIPRELQSAEKQMSETLVQ